MRRSILPVVVSTLACAIVSTPAAQARIGETKDQCVARYGPVRSTMPSVVMESDPEAALFDYGSFGVIVHFQKGLAWHISYAQAYISDPDKQRLLKENSETGEWLPRRGELVGKIFVWNNRDAGMVACTVNSPSLNTIEIMTRACSEAFARTRAKRIEDAVLDLAKRPAATAARTAAPAAKQGVVQQPALRAITFIQG